MGTEAEDERGNGGLKDTSLDTSDTLSEDTTGENGGAVLDADTAGDDAVGDGGGGAAGAGGGGGGNGGNGGGGTKVDLWETIIVVSALAVTTIGALGIWFYAVKRFDKDSRVEITIAWTRPAEFRLQPGPPHFWYDDEKKQLRHLGLVDDDLKTQLIALTGKIADGNQTLQEAAAGYIEAINQLAYQSEMKAAGLFAFSLLLGGLSGLLGVQLRSVTNFVAVRCLKPEKWDFPRWWPWYVMRPVAGFLLGVVLILVVEGGLIEAGELTSANLSWRLGVAFLAGFGSTDFTDRLRLVAQTLFGGTPASRPG